MRINYVLIDFENVQPKNMSLLIGGPFKIKIFLGVNQTKIPREIATTMQEFGAEAEYIEAGGSGKNALDFHIAYYIGKLSTETPDAFFHIISKDTDFDPLIKYLNNQKLSCLRSAQITDIPLLKIENPQTDLEKVDAIVSFLRKRGNARPRTKKTLGNTVKSLFANKLSEKEILDLVELLIEKKQISIENLKLIYKL
jgi:PIN domain